MLEALIKQITTTKAFAGLRGGSEQDHRVTADWSDFNTQKAIVKEAFLGKEDILGEANAEPLDITKDLDFTEKNEDPATRPARAGRPPKAV